MQAHIVIPLCVDACQLFTAHWLNCSLLMHNWTDISSQHEICSTLFRMRAVFFLTIQCWLLNSLLGFETSSLSWEDIFECQGSFLCKVKGGQWVVVMWGFVRSITFFLKCITYTRIYSIYTQSVVLMDFHRDLYPHSQNLCAVSCWNKTLVAVIFGFLRWFVGGFGTDDYFRFPKC